ncbi:hypothetical protein FB451DRAFT_1161533 [Mycena latifolia]|nr:hypothetical protein FB451DRAFT_1161533 [Mycena latifolia]
MTSPAPSSNSAYRPFSPKLGSRLSRSLMPPLPPLPFTNSHPSTTQRAGSIQISHPYALAPHPRKSAQTSSPSQTDPKLPAQVPQPVTNTNANFVALELPKPGLSLSPTLASFPSPPAATSILKPKLKVRTRRSPAIGPIGPSPLRTMILPESLDGELSSYGHARANDKENPDVKDRPVSIHSPYASLGGRSRVGELGSGSGTYAGAAKGSSNNTVLKAKRRHSSVSSRRASKVEEDDPGVLLRIIRELVEETNEWDPSRVFMSQNFKTMLQESGIKPTKSARGFGARRTEESSGFVESESDKSARSTEVDIGLLGLDIFTSESFGSYHADDSTNLVSFWEEESTERYGYLFDCNSMLIYTQ